MIGDVLKRYPQVAEMLKEINPMFGMINSVMGRQMAKIATLEMMSNRSGVPVDELIQKIEEMMNRK